MPSFQIDYCFRNQPRSKVIEADGEQFPLDRAAHYLIELHYSDAENSLLMPAPNASAEQLQEQAELLGISAIHVRKLARSAQANGTSTHC